MPRDSFMVARDRGLGVAGHDESGKDQGTYTIESGLSSSYNNYSKDMEPRTQRDDIQQMEIERTQMERTASISRDSSMERDKTDDMYKVSNGPGGVRTAMPDSPEHTDQKMDGDGVNEGDSRRNSVDEEPVNDHEKGVFRKAKERVSSALGVGA